MVLLLDENISWRLKKKIESEFSECIHVSDISKQCFKDREIWDYARTNRCLLITFDEDFCELLSLHGFPPKIIWLRCGNISTEALAALLIRNKTLIEELIMDSENGILEIY